MKNTKKFNHILIMSSQDDDNSKKESNNKPDHYFLCYFIYGIADKHVIKQVQELKIKTKS